MQGLSQFTTLMSQFTLNSSVGAAPNRVKVCIETNKSLSSLPPSYVSASKSGPTVSAIWNVKPMQVFVFSKHTG